jgi:hypothetical protein
MDSVEEELGIVSKRLMVKILSKEAFSKMSIQLYNYGVGWVLCRCFCCCCGFNSLSPPLSNLVVTQKVARYIKRGIWGLIRLIWMNWFEQVDGEGGIW